MRSHRLVPLTLLWLVPAAIVTVFGMLAGSNDWTTVASQFAGGFLISLLPWHRTKKLWSAGVAVLFLILIVTGVLVWHVSSLAWQASPGNLPINSLTLIDGSEQIDTWGNQRWEISGEPDLILVAFEAKRASVDDNPSWFQSSSAIDQFDYVEDGVQVSRIRFPETRDPYVMRTFDLGSALAGSSFRLSADLRSESIIPESGCRGLWLQTWYEGEALTCQAVHMDNQWRTHNLFWTVPERSTSSVIRMLLNDFNGHEIEIRNVQLHHLSGDEWVLLEPMLPANGYISVRWQGGQAEALAGEAIILNSQQVWERQEYTLQVPSGNPTSIRVELNNGSNAPSLAVPLQVRATNAEPAGSAGSLRQIRSFALFEGRQSWWFSHPNLAAHTVVMLTVLLLLATNQPTRTTALIAALGLFTLLLTGSRIALIGGVWLFAWSVYYAHWFRRNRWTLTLAIAVIGLVAGLFFTGQLGRGSALLDVENGASRVDIWNTALGSLADDPFAQTAKDFSAVWATANPASAETVRHAHNMFLQFSFMNGLPGLFALAFFFIVVLVMAVRAGKKYVFLLVPVLLLQLFDATFTYVWVFTATIIGSTFIAGAAQPQQRVPEPGA